MATTGDRYLATSGYFFMATDKPEQLMPRDEVFRLCGD